MPNVLFVSTDTNFTNSISSSLPTGFTVVNTTDTESAMSAFKSGNYDATFILWSTPNGTTGDFDGTNLVNWVRNTANSTSPLFIVVPTTSSSSAPSWQTTHSFDGYVIWDGNGSSFLNQVRETLNRFNIQAA